MKGKMEERKGCYEGEGRCEGDRCWKIEGDDEEGCRERRMCGRGMLG